MDEDKEIKKRFIKKLNDLIDQAHFDLTAVQYKLVLYAIAQIDENDLDFRTLEIKVKDFIKEFNGKKSYYEILKTEAKEIMQRPLSIQKSNNDWLHISWFSSVEYLSDKSSVRIEFNPSLKPYLLQPQENYTVISLDAIRKIDTEPALRLYEFLAQYKRFGKRYFDLENFKLLLKLDENNSYKRYSNFKKKVILPSIERINKFSDIFITKFEEKKQSRKVIGFTLYFYAKDEKKIYDPNRERIKKIMQHLPPEYQYNRDVLNIIRFNLDKDDECIISSIEYALKHAKENFPGYLLETLKNDYSKEYREKKEEEEKKLRRKKEKERSAQIKEQKQRQLEERINEYINSLSPEEYNSLREQAIQYVKEHFPPELVKSEILIRARIFGIVKEILRKQDPHLKKR